CHGGYILNTLFPKIKNQTMGSAPTACTAAIRHAGDELLACFPIFEHWPRIFQDMTENSAHGTVLSEYVLAGQVAIYCQEPGVLQLEECVGAYVERHLARTFCLVFGEKQDLEWHLKCVDSLATSIHTYFFWKRISWPTLPPTDLKQKLQESNTTKCLQCICSFL
uniref:Uncharacterized protein n=1 Tax=Amphilophus citrinellus TaxID=61819 RepID=A0A3Q0RW67_AMPCI